MCEFRRGRRSIVIARAAVLCGLAGAAPAHAQDKIDVQVWAIRATNANRDVSPELKELAETFRKSGLAYTGYKLERKASGSVEAGQPYATALIGDFSARVTPRRDKGRMQLDIQVLRKERDREKPVVKTAVTVDPGRFQPVGGPKLDGGDVLIVAVTGR